MNAKHAGWWNAFMSSPAPQKSSRSPQSARSAAGGNGRHSRLRRGVARHRATTGLLEEDARNLERNTRNMLSGLFTPGRKVGAENVGEI